jgi:hypothetical protein
MTDNRINDDELTEADRIVEELYERSKRPIPWDESDEAILAFAREAIPEKDDEHAAPAETPDVRSGGGSMGPTESEDNVVPFDRQRRSFMSRVVHSPAVGFSLAASVMIGIFTGQSLTPYVDLGVAPGYRNVLDDNKRLQRELTDNRALLTRSLGGQNVAVAGLTELAKVLGQFKCSQLTAKMTKGAQVVISGHVSTAQDLELLNSQIAPLGRNVSLNNEAEVRGWPFCEALEVLHEAGGAGANPNRLPIVGPHEHGASYVKDERLVVMAQATSIYDGYLYVDFIQHDGKVLHMRAEGQLDGKTKRGQRLLLGTEAEKYLISAPFGTEMLVAISSPTPLFEKARPQVEDAKRYLQDLQEALSRAKSANVLQPVVSNYQFITTQTK